MPEYLAPGVYAEEVSFRSKSVEGVSTSGTAFVGPTATGPVGGTPELLTSFADFERIYGGEIAVERLAASGKEPLSLRIRASGSPALEALLEKLGGPPRVAS